MTVSAEKVYLIIKIGYMFSFESISKQKNSLIKNTIIKKS